MHTGVVFPSLFSPSLSVVLRLRENDNKECNKIFAEEKTKKVSLFMLDTTSTPFFFFVKEKTRKKSAENLEKNQHRKKNKNNTHDKVL